MKKGTPAKSAKHPGQRSGRIKDPEPVENLDDQQRLLQVFVTAFNDTISSDDFPSVIQQVKRLLFEREFEAAFAREEYLDAYAARWSPTRALCYAAVLGSLSTYLADISLPASSETLGTSAARIEEPGRLGGVDREAGKTVKMLSVGGGAAELVAFSSFLRTQKDTCGLLTLVDSGPWELVVSKLQDTLINPPPLSRYASAAARQSNIAFLAPSRLSSMCVKADILALDVIQLSEWLGSRPCLVTVLFTLNELYTSGGIGRTTAFLAALTAAVVPGTLLLVVDSPGSYSETTVGRESKQYPMHWLLDHTLLKTGQQDAAACGWEKLESQDSTWFRLPKSLNYPIPLEDMRYQMHLYRAMKLRE